MKASHGDKSMATVEDCAVEFVAVMLNDRFGEWGPWHKISDDAKRRYRHHAAEIIEATHGFTDNVAEHPERIDYLPSLFGQQAGVGIAYDDLVGLRPSTFSSDPKVRMR